MKKYLLSLLIALIASPAMAGSILIEGFEYANHDLERPIGWSSDNNAWLSGYLEKDHNRIPHSGNWYAFSNADDAWMFMQLYLIPTMQYRVTCWAISDGSCQLEFWAGSSPAIDDMHTLLLANTSPSAPSLEPLPPASPSMTSKSTWWSNTNSSQNPSQATRPCIQGAKARSASLYTM